MKYQTILFDFDGVLCKGRFYEKTLLPSYRKVYDWIQENIFGKEELVHKWMRNQINSAGINQMISENTGIEYKTLNELYEESIHKLKLEKEIISTAKQLKISGNKIGIVTDNMDIFTQITVPTHQLDMLFDSIINSADHGLLKKDNKGKLFDITLATLGKNIENSILIDDSEATIELYEKKGGRGFVYRNITELKSFLRARE